jgi:hypothetical protein
MESIYVAIALMAVGFSSAVNEISGLAAVHL